MCLVTHKICKHTPKPLHSQAVYITSCSKATFEPCKLSLRKRIHPQNDNTESKSEQTQATQLHANHSQPNSTVAHAALT
jgi:hypothetical protein